LANNSKNDTLSKIKKILEVAWKNTQMI
jgi:hypothetical protein